MIPLQSKGKKKQRKNCNYFHLWLFRLKFLKFFFGLIVARMDKIRKSYKMENDINKKNVKCILAVSSI